MCGLKSGKKNIFFSSIFVGAGVFAILKGIAIFLSYGYLFPQMGLGRSLYFFLLVFQSDLLIFGGVCLLGILREKYLQYKMLSTVLVGVIALIATCVLLDILAMFVYQQRFSLFLLSGFFSSSNYVVGRYFLGFIAIVVCLSGLIWFLTQSLHFVIIRSVVISLVIVSLGL